MQEVQLSATVAPGSALPPAVVPGGVRTLAHTPVLRAQDTSARVQAAVMAAVAQTVAYVAPLAARTHVQAARPRGTPVPVS